MVKEHIIMYTIGGNAILNDALKVLEQIRPSAAVAQFVYISRQCGNPAPRSVSDSHGWSTGPTDFVIC
jgi:hypothetical protein